MGTFSIWHWLIVGAVVLVLFGGRGKISALMGDLGKGLKAFKNNIKEDDGEKSGDAVSQTNTQVSHQDSKTPGDTVGDTARDKQTSAEKQNS